MCRITEQNKPRLPRRGISILVGSVFLGIPTLSIGAPHHGAQPFTVVPKHSSHSPSVGRSVAAVDLSRTIWERVSDKYGVDPLVLYAVALIESGRSDGVQVKPWAWAINEEGRGHYHPNKSSAWAGIQIHLASGRRSLDIGFMQVNLKWHRKRVQHLEDLLDPHTNIDLGARILSEAMATCPGNLALGIGRYHAWSNRVLALRYGRRVLQLADRLRHKAS